MRTLTILLLMLCLGCGQKTPTAPVSGRVTFKGRPVARYDVIFEPLLDNDRLGDFATGRTDEDGRYTLKAFKTQKNAVGVGRCRVRITWSDPDADPENDVYHPAPFKLPPAASDNSLTFDVPEGGTGHADFEFP